MSTPSSDSLPSPALLAEAMKRAVKRADAALDAVLPQPDGLHGRVAEAMRYAVFAGGKRLRPFLVLEGAALFGADPDGAARAAAAIEALHTYSLVHDDLPAMDDDDLRRGRPTTHRQFNEATAILAGDALLTIAFEILSDPATHPSAEVRCKLITRLAQAGGAQGMIGGQMIDMLSAERAYGQDDIVLLQRMKTGALFEMSAEAGPILAQAGADDVERLHSFAVDFGLLFQITDDLLDVLGDAATAGKAVGKDQEQGKQTLVGSLGLEGARREARRLAERASQTLSLYGAKADALRALPFELLDRTS
ncbi:MAG: Farnesyl-diphosphate synthase [Caulobacteraceae bacterium]|nr:Farnesyl-diphosphate synthase [Caulobacteraceae bacterium]